MDIEQDFYETFWEKKKSKSVFRFLNLDQGDFNCSVEGGNWWFDLTRLENKIPKIVIKDVNKWAKKYNLKYLYD